MLYTRKGDEGTTKTLDTPKGQRISKSSCQTESLGTLDELNSFLGLLKVKAQKSRLEVSGMDCYEVVHGVQKNLFIVQAELAGAMKSIENRKVTDVEALIDTIEKSLPPIKTFFISGGTELAAMFDICRTIARRAERQCVAYNEVANEVGALPIPPRPSGEASLTSEYMLRPLSKTTMSYLNRLSSLLYALARFSNHAHSVEEIPPDYL